MKTDRSTGRQREVALIRTANRAAAIGRLMLGEMRDWQEFLEADSIDLDRLPRRSLKSGAKDIKQRLKSEINRFCQKNFSGMDAGTLSRLYEEIKGTRGLEMPLLEFENCFSTIRPEVIRGSPRHLTVCISLWGFQLKFPEDTLSHDVVEAIETLRVADSRLQEYENMHHLQLRSKQTEIQSLLRKELFAARSTLIGCFNLVEAYLNGLAWDFVQLNDISELSNRQIKLLNDSASTSIREKLLKLPELISGKAFWSSDDPDVAGFLDIVKPFRDSLVHPSPFSAPEKFGGYDKLRHLYRIGTDTAKMTVAITARLLERIYRHIHQNAVQLPRWMDQIVSVA